MPDPLAFEPVLSAQAAIYLAGLPRRQQKRLVELLFRLAQQPYQLGDYSTKDDRGRELQNLLLGEWHLAYWPDERVKELRIVEITEI